MSKEFLRILTKNRMWVPLNFRLIESVGLNAAALYAVLSYKCPEKGIAYQLDAEKIDIMLSWSRTSRLKAEEVLISMGLVKKQLKKGMPPQNWYTLFPKVADDLLDGMTPKGSQRTAQNMPMDGTKHANGRHKKGQWMAQNGSSENAVSPDGEKTSEENRPVKNKRKNNTKKNIVPPPKAGGDGTTQLKDPAPQVRAPIDTAVAFASVQKALAAGGGTDGAPTINLAGSSSSLAGGNGTGAGDGGGTAKAPDRKDAAEISFIHYFVGEFEKVHGIKPIIDYKGGKATAMARKILKLMEGRKGELGRIVTRYVKNVDPFYSQQGWPLGLLTSDAVLQKHSDFAWKQQKYADKISGGVIDTSVSRGRRLDAP